MELNGVICLDAGNDLCHRWVDGSFAYGSPGRPFIRCLLARHLYLMALVGAAVGIFYEAKNAMAEVLQDGIVQLIETH